MYRARGGTSNVNKARQISRNAESARARRFQGAAKCPKTLYTILERIGSGLLTGKPGEDWLAVRRLLSGSGTAELQLVARLVVYLMAFNRGRRISDRLAEIWQRVGAYQGARRLVESAITEDQIVGSDGDLVGINVMTMHKSKGKEFDGVIVLHLGNGISPFSPDSETAPFRKSRRLLRVAITRARDYVLMLTDGYNRSPLLRGHKLGSP